MLVIRLQRVGKTHQPSYRIVVSERRSKLGGPPVEDLGAYSSFTKETALKADRVKHWLAQGAKATPTVHNLLVREGVIQAAKIKLHIPLKAKEEAKAEVPSMEAAPASAGESA